MNIKKHFYFDLSVCQVWRVEDTFKPFYTLSYGFKVEEWLARFLDWQQDSINAIILMATERTWKEKGELQKSRIFLSSLLDPWMEYYFFEFPIIQYREKVSLGCVELHFPNGEKLPGKIKERSRADKIVRRESTCLPGCLAVNQASSLQVMLFPNRFGLKLPSRQAFLPPSLKRVPSISHSDRSTGHIHQCQTRQAAATFYCFAPAYFFAAVLRLSFSWTYLLGSHAKALNLARPHISSKSFLWWQTFTQNLRRKMPGRVRND